MGIQMNQPLLHRGNKLQNVNRKNIFSGQYPDFKQWEGEEGDEGEEEAVEPVPVQREVGQTKLPKPSMGVGGG